MIPKNVNNICLLAADDIHEYISTGDKQYLYMAFECVKLAVELLKMEESPSHPSTEGGLS